MYNLNTETATVMKLYCTKIFTSVRFFSIEFALKIVETA